MQRNSSYHIPDAQGAYEASAKIKLIHKGCLNLEFPVEKCQLTRHKVDEK